MTGYPLLKSLTWLIHKMPNRVLYFHSDLLFLLIFHIIRYRRDVVTQNLANSFPDKNKTERDQIASKYYHHLCDCLFETLYFARISPKEAQERAKFINPELANQYMDQKRQVIILMGHYNNWECFNSWGLHSKHPSYAVYKKLKSEPFEKFYHQLRSRFGSDPLERASTFKQLMVDAKAQTPKLSLLLIDQTPRANDIHYWTTFLNQETAVLMGPEKIGMKLDSVVIFGNTQKVKRGFYEVEFVLVTDDAKHSPKFEITEKSTRLLEKQIVANPEFWLWSHRRWKHKRAVVEALCN